MRVSYAKHKSNVQLGKKRRTPGLTLLFQSQIFPSFSLLTHARNSPTTPTSPHPRVESMYNYIAYPSMGKETDFHMKKPEVGGWAGGFPALPRGRSPRDHPAAPAADLFIT